MAAPRSVVGSGGSMPAPPLWLVRMALCNSLPALPPWLLWVAIGRPPLWLVRVALYGRPALCLVRMALWFNHEAMKEESLRVSSRNIASRLDETFVFAMID